ncbi:MAG: hypothetical protein IPH28_19515 [Cytophagaceae bacterium]|nr:hypothetical protein [Cytophagaceae bacterium]
MIKRRLREAYRLNKVVFEKPLNIAFIYVASEILTFEKIEIAMRNCLKKIKNDKSKTQPIPEKE